MSWWGKIAGGTFGFIFGGVLGAVLGAAVGHRLDEALGSGDEDVGRGSTGWGAPPKGDQERVQTAFFVATFSVLGYMAKADGVVSRDEIRMTEAIMDEMDLDEDKRRLAIDLFNQGKSPEFEFDALMRQFRQECARRRDLMRAFVEIQLQVAFADGHLHEAERRVIRRISGHLHFGADELLNIERFIRAWEQAREAHSWGRRGGSGGRSSRAQRPASGGGELAAAYALLGVESTDSDAVVKRAYRRLTSQHHPDKLVAKGLPEEMMRAATEKTQMIRQAYETIMAARKGS